MLPGRDKHLFPGKKKKKKKHLIQAINSLGETERRREAAAERQRSRDRDRDRRTWERLMKSTEGREVS